MELLVLARPYHMNDPQTVTIDFRETFFHLHPRTRSSTIERKSKKESLRRSDVRKR